MDFIPTFKSNDGNISLVQYVKGMGAAFVSSSAGVVSKVVEFPTNPFGRGLTQIFAQIRDGEGYLSNTVHASLYYDLYWSIVRLDGETDDYSILKDQVEAFDVSGNTKVTARYTSEVLKADEDFGFWKSISWTQNSDSGRVVVAVKVGESESEVRASDWQYYISPVQDDPYGGVSPSEYSVTKSLDRFNLKGRFMMFKVDLETTSENENPIVGDLVITFAAKHSVFFYTQKFKVDRDVNIDDILLTASLTEPKKTEILFGVANSATANWEDYKIVDLDQLVELSSVWGNIMKVGIKMSSYSSTVYPTVHEFGFLLGADSDNELNQ